MKSKDPNQLNLFSEEIEKDFKKEKKKEHNKKWRNKNKDYQKDWRKKNKERYNKYQKDYQKDYQKEWRKDNKDKLKEYHKEYSKEWRDNNKENLNEYSKERYKTNNLFRLTQNIRNMLLRSFNNKGYKKNSKTENILGCDFLTFKQHLESKFEPWMNWNNFGNWDGTPSKENVSWDIDHIIPISSAKNEEDIIKLNHYTNLQPLCSYHNRYVKRNN